MTDRQQGPGAEQEPGPEQGPEPEHESGPEQEPELERESGSARESGSEQESGPGRVPPGYRLPAGSRPGMVRLLVSDLERSRAFYTNVLGLAVMEDASGTAPDRLVLGPAGGEPFVELRSGARTRGATLAPEPRLGLYHFAVLVPDRPSLGRALRRLLEHGIRPGAADHRVSEALYLSDPDGLGIEIYADRPRETWRRAGDELVMATDPLDVGAVLAAAGAEDAEVARPQAAGLPAGTRIGHMHLHVGDLALAQAFYHEGLGLDLKVWSYPGALFLAAGGYHHHLGVNTWAGRRARPPEPEEPQLLAWELRLPAADNVAEAAASLASAGGAAAQARPGAPEADEDSAAPDVERVVRDPWGTTLRLTASS